MTAVNDSNGEAMGTARSTNQRALTKRVALGAILSLLLVATAPAWAGAQEAAPGELRLVHGLRGVVADVYLDDVLTLQTFQPERSTDLIAVAPGTHRVDVRLAGVDASEPPMLTGTFDVVSGQNVSAVLHLSTTALPELSTFEDSQEAVAAGQTRVIIRHTAAAPAIDVTLDSGIIAADLTNPSQAVRQVAAGSYEVTVTQAGIADVLAAPQAVSLAEGTANEMYLIGDQAAGTLAWIAVQTTGLQTAPTQIETGDSGLAAEPEDRAIRWPFSLALLAGCVFVAASITVTRRLRIA